MQEKIKNYFLERVQQEWKDVPFDYQPWAMWIRHYAAISADSTDGIDSSAIPLQAWFLTKDGLFARNIWEYQRLQTVHFIQPWCGRMHGESSNWWVRNQKGIGFAAFAQYENTLDFYFDCTWERLFGRGWRVKFDENGEAVDWEGLWLS